MFKTTVHVTQSHIKTSEPRDPWKSAICLALADAGFRNASVIGDAFLDNKGGGRTRVYLPRKVHVAASELCNWELVAPFSFELEYPENIVREEVFREEGQFEISL